MASEEQRAIRVIGLCGSLRPGSFTRRALAVALDGAAEQGVETALIDLRDYDLIFCDGRGDGDLPPGVHRLRQEVRDAKGILLATPEYHGGYSGVLKNALDLMGFEEFDGKMIGLIGVSGGRMGAANALHALRDVGRALHAWVVPEQAAIPEARRQFDELGRLTDPRLEERLKAVGRQVARFACLHNAEKLLEFVREWEQAPRNPGGENR
jgi:NAD(P)H-dependent FMN reductase